MIGYENRRLKAEDFNDDQKDAGDMGDGHTVTALYEIVPRGARVAGPSVDTLKYQSARSPAAAADSGELMTVKVRYKHPESRRSRLLSAVVRDRRGSFDEASDDMRFAAAVAGFGMLLRESPHVVGLRLDDVRRMARSALGADRHGYRHEFLELIDAARGTEPRALAVD